MKLINIYKMNKITKYRIPMGIAFAGYIEIYYKDQLLRNCGVFKRYNNKRKLEIIGYEFRNQLVGIWKHYFEYVEFISTPQNGICIKFIK